MNNNIHKYHKLTTKSDIQLWNEIKKGNADALSTLFYRFYEDLFFYGEKLTSNKDRIADTIQDIFVKLWESRANNSDVSFVKAYIFKVFRNKLLKKKSKLIICSLISNDFNYSDKKLIISCEDLIIGKEIKSEVKTSINTILKKLTPRQREIIYLKFYCDFSNTEISNTLSIEKQSVSNMLYRIFKSIRKKIKISGSLLHLESVSN